MHILKEENNPQHFPDSERVKSTNIPLSPPREFKFQEQLCSLFQDFWQEANYNQTGNFSPDVAKLEDTWMYEI